MEIVAFAIIVLGVLGLQEWLFGRFVLRKLEYICDFSEKEAYEGDSLFLVETVHNKKLLPVPWLKVDINSSRWLEYANTKSVVAQEFRYVTSSFFLKGYQKVTRRWKLKCLKRGVYTIKSVTLISGDLIGRNTVSTPVEIDAVITVYPALIRLENFFIPVRQLQGDTIVRRWILEDPFIVSGAREYTPRDPMNRVHWNATARQGSLMVRKNDYTAQTGITVLLNIQSMETEYFDAVHKDWIEMGIKAAATIFDTALREGTPVRLVTNGSTVDGGKEMIFTSEASGREHVLQLMHLLAKLELRAIKDFEEYLETVLTQFYNTDIILITAYVTERIRNLMRLVIRRNCSVKILVLDRFIEQSDLPQDMEVYILAGDESENGQES